VSASANIQLLCPGSGSGSGTFSTTVGSDVMMVRGLVTALNFALLIG